MIEQTPVFETLNGSVERVTFHNPDNGYSVLRIKAKGKREPVTVLGHVPTVSAGEYLEAMGEWVQHPEYGLQFRATEMKTIQPNTLEGIEKYLGSGMVKGIGPHFAKKLVSTFGASVFDVIENEIERLREVEGIGQVRKNLIGEAWKEQKVVRDIMVFLQSHGVSPVRAVRIYKTYGQNAIEKVKENPYQLAHDVQGIGFKSADLIAGHLGIPRGSILRAKAGLHHVLFERTSEGHSAYPISKLIEDSKEILDMEPLLLKTGLNDELNAQKLRLEQIEGVECIYPNHLFHAENEVANHLKRLMGGIIPWNKIHVEKAIEWVQGRLTISLDPLQVDALREILSSKVTILTGGPGTGKTTLTRALVTILGAKGIKMALCSPTGRAAKRLSECTGLEAKTIHRLLGVDRKSRLFVHNSSNPLDIDLLIVDEASMLDIVLTYHLLKAIPSRAALLFVGDVDQLPSVGPGRVLGAMIDSRVIKKIRLTHIFRQAQKSRIIKAAHDVNNGLIPELHTTDKDSDLYFLSSDTPEDTLSTLLDLVSNRIPKRFHFDAIRDIQVLCPMNRGGLGTRSLNIELQRVLNPNPVLKVEKFGTTFGTGDKVMVTENDYDKEIFNGDIGMIQTLDLEESVATVLFDERKIEFSFSELDILSLAYAITVHKSQGSEYPAIVMPVTTQHFLMLKRNLIYTGITRGKKLVILVGQKKALAIAIKNNSQDERWNNLSKRCQSTFGPER